ncbi:MAG TPA: GFA family protein [Polyangiaceae bacterium]|jgi:hypothetical protein|nr:GFA family protein [Polyangiaceae bacterium]
MPETKTYTGACHCKNVRFEVKAAIERAGACNCSICSKVGWLTTSVPKADFKLLAGEAAQLDYQFGPKMTHHYFCKTCGIHAFAPYSYGGEDKVVVNLRCIDGLNVAALEVQTFDGASF